MNNRDYNQTEAPKNYLTPADAAQAIYVLQLVLDRLEANRGHDRLQACIGFAQEALWAAAYPYDPSTMLNLIADQAQNAMG